MRRSTHHVTVQSAAVLMRFRGTSAFATSSCRTVAALRCSRPLLQQQPLTTSASSIPSINISQPNHPDVVVDIDTEPVTGVYGTCLYGLETLLADYYQSATSEGVPEGVRSVTVYTTLVHKSAVKKINDESPKEGDKSKFLDSSATRKAFRSGRRLTTDPSASSPPSPHAPTSRTIASKAPTDETVRVFTLQQSGVVLDGKRFPVVPAFTFRPSLRYPTLEPPKGGSSSSSSSKQSMSATTAVTMSTVGPRVLSPGTKHAEVVVFEAIEYLYEHILPDGQHQGAHAASILKNTPRKAVHNVGVFAEGSVVGFGVPDVGIQALLSLVMHPYADPKDAMLVPKRATVSSYNSAYRVPALPPTVEDSCDSSEVVAVPPSYSATRGNTGITSSSVFRSFPALLKTPLSSLPTKTASHPPPPPTAALPHERGLGGLIRRLLQSRREDEAAIETIEARGRRKDRTFHPQHTIQVATPVYIVTQILTATHIVVRSRFALLPTLPKEIRTFLYNKHHQQQQQEVAGDEAPLLPTTHDASADGENDEVVLRDSIVTTHTRPHSLLLANSDPMSSLPFMFGIHELVLLRGYTALMLPIRSKVSSWQHHVSRTGVLPMTLKEARVLKAGLLRISSRQAKIANTRHRILWEERHVHARQQFLATSEHFEMGAASEELKHRGDVLQASVAYLCDQAHQEKDYYLEYIIILLIMVEVYLAMDSHGLGLWDDEEGGEGSFWGGGHHHRPTTTTPTTVVGGVEKVAVEHSNIEGEVADLIMLRGGSSVCCTTHPNKEDDKYRHATTPPLPPPDHYPDVEIVLPTISHIPPPPSSSSSLHGNYDKKGVMSYINDAVLKDVRTSTTGGKQTKEVLDN